MIGGLLSGASAVIADQGEPPERLLDLWSERLGDLRARTSERGFDTQAVYTLDAFSNLRGGASRGVEFPGNFDLLLQLDAERAFGWRGTSFLAYFLGNHGGDPSDLAGDAQTLDNIAAPSTFKLYEMWGEVRLNPQFSLLVGLYDLNSEFDVIESSRLFINSSFGIGADFSQSGRNGPSIFPTTSVGLRAKFHPTLRFYLQTAVLDGVAGDPDDPSGTRIIIDDDDGALIVAEGAWLLRPASDQVPEARRLRARRIGRQQDWRHEGKVALGAWAYSRRQEVIGADPADPQRARSRGAYLLAERRVIQETDDPEQGLDLFARFGVAATRVNRFGSSIVAGVMYTGPFPGRDGDQIGLAITSARNGDEFRSALSGSGTAVDDAEIAIELTYAARVRPWLLLQPDLQYIINPDTDPRLGDALAVGLRIAIAF